ncbi:DDE-type integrase/transposase/recombinase [Aduncisulcus paluster]|uniref:RNA-directed DNA polymerase n=1 Tax=Aduncisulcus paluster TaxID=2918883 RepID=A0ABQ5KIK1_9EUKA|nr:DDE-type integrase/transposase/recombinase [Aduncisulcus paluster]
MPKHGKIIRIGVAKMKEKEVPTPYLESLDSENWKTFMKEYEHYRTLGGRRAWPFLCSSKALRLISIIANIKDFSNRENRIAAKGKVGKVYRGDSPQSLSDTLKGIRMEHSLTMKAISDYISDFDTSRSLDPTALEGKAFVNLFIGGLFPPRLRVRVRTAIGPDSEDVEEAIRQSLEHGSDLVRCVEEGRVVLKQLGSREQGKDSKPTPPRHDSKPEEKEKSDRPRNAFGGKRRKFHSKFKPSPTKKQSHAGLQQDKPVGKKPKFLKGIFCKDCHEEGHYSYNCPLRSKSNGKYLFNINGTDPSVKTAFISGSSDKEFKVSYLLDTGATQSVITDNTVKRCGLQSKPSHIKEVFLANGSSIPVLGYVEINIRLLGPDGASITFPDSCLIIEQVSDRSPNLLIGEEKITSQSLFDWQDPQVEENSTFIEDELYEELVSPLDDMGSEWECEIDELIPEITELLHQYFGKIDKRKPAKVPTFSLLFPPDKRPPAMKARRVPFHLQSEVKSLLDELLDLEFISPSKSPFAAPIVLTRRGNGQLRLCCDFTRLNQITPNDQYPIPRQDSLFTALAGKTVFGALDLRRGYFNIEVAKNTKHVTAFITPWGLFQWNRMPFGLKSAPAHFQRCVNNIFKDLTPCCCLIYLDDILVYGKDNAEFMANLKRVLNRLAEFNFCLNLSKCKIGMREVKYLGFIISDKGRRIDPKKLEDLRNLTVPKSLKDLQKMVGKINYLREFILDHSRVAEPLTRIMRKPFKSSAWGPEQSAAWVKILEQLERCITLNHPSSTGHFIVRTDASNSGIGGILLQTDHLGKEKLINLFARKFNKTESKWSTCEQEAFGVFYGITSNAYFLLGKQFVVETDHRNLGYIYKSEVPKLIRWRMKLSPFSFSIKHIPGASNSTSDFLSRLDEFTEPSRPLLITHRDTKVFSLKAGTPDSNNLLLKKIHIELGHASPKLMINALVERGIRWKSMAMDAKSICKTCLICQKSKKGKQPNSLAHLRASYVFERVSVDTVGPLEPDKNEFKHFMVVIDDFSRFTIIIPVKSLTAEEISQSLFASVFSIHGCPGTIRSDGGFTSALTAELCRLCDIKSIITLPYNHEENGLVERANREVRRLIRAFYMSHEVQDYRIDAGMMSAAINSRIHSATKVAPYTAVFGTLRRLNTVPFEPHPAFTSSKDSIEKLNERISSVHEFLKKNQEESYRKRDKPMKETDLFEIGESILLFPKVTPKKQSPVLQGPFIISEIHGEKFTLTSLDKSRTFIAPRRRLRKYHKGTESEETITKISAKDENEFIVEKIIRKRYGTKRPIEFRVRWAGYGPDEDSWLTWKEVKDLEALDKFLEENASLKNKIESKKTRLR